LPSQIKKINSSGMMMNNASCHLGRGKALSFTKAALIIVSKNIIFQPLKSIASSGIAKKF